MSQYAEKSCVVFDRALAALNSCNGTLYIKAVSTTQFYSGLNQLVGLCKKKGLRLEYYSKDRLLILQPMPGPVHDCIQSWFEWEVQRMAEEGFIKKGHWLKYISRNFSIDFHDFKGSHEDSWKAPDISVHSNGQSLPNLVIEVAFSETRDHVRRKAAFWLGATPNVVQVVIVICIDEMEPRQRASATQGENVVPEGSEVDTDDDEWVGDLKISLEVWRNSITGVYREVEIALRDVTSTESAQEHAARVYSDESSLEFDDYNLNGPTFVLKSTDFFGTQRLPQSSQASDTFIMRTDTLRAFVTRYRRMLGRNRRTQSRARARARIGFDAPYVD